MHTNRRRFLSLAAGAAAGTLTAAQRLLAPASAAEPEPLPIVDTHQHLWDLERFKLPWLENSPQLKRSFLPDDYRREVAGLSVVKAVYMEVDVEAGQKRAEAEWLIDLCRRKVGVTVAGVVGGRPGEEGFRQYVAQFRGSAYVKGVRQVFRGPGPLREKAFVADIRLLGELGLSFDLCLPPGDLPAAIDLVDACPGTRFILDHCGNADPKAFRKTKAEGPAAAQPGHDADAWRRDIERLAQRKGAICKISGIVARAPKDDWTADDLAPIVNHCLDSFGPERVVFGSDWPVCTRVASLRQWVEALRQIVRGRSVEQQRKLWHDNAVRWYGLSTEN